MLGLCEANCRLEQVSTKEHGKMLNEFRFSKTAGFLRRGQNIGKLKGKKRRITRKEYQRLLNVFEMEGFMAQKELWNLARDKASQDRGALPREEGDPIREFQAMHEKRSGSG